MKVTKQVPEDIKNDYVICLTHHEAEMLAKFLMTITWSSLPTPDRKFFTELYVELPSALGEAYDEATLASEPE